MSYLPWILLVFGIAFAGTAFAGETPTSRLACSIMGVYSGSCTNAATGETVQNSIQLGSFGGLGNNEDFDWSHCADNYTLQYSSLQITDTDSVLLDQYPFNGGRLEFHPVVNDLGGTRTSVLWADVSSATDFTLHRLDRFDVSNPAQQSRSFSHQADTQIHQIDATHVAVDMRFTLKGSASGSAAYHCASLERVKKALR